MANEEINEYTDVATVPDNNARFDMDDWDGAAFVSTQITFANLKAALGAGHLGNTDLVQTDIVRTFDIFSDESAAMLIFRNSSLSNSLTINGQCDVYNHGLNSVATNLFYGLDTGRNITGERNTTSGVEALKEATTGDDNTAIGYSAGKYEFGTTNDNDLGTESTFIGSQAYPLNNDDENSIVIGYNTSGQGSNTVVIGNGNITDNYLNGNLHITSLAGVGDRNVVADASGMLKIGTSLSLISHYTNFAGFPGTGSVEVIYIADDVDEMYIWNASAAGYKKIGGETIYSADSQFIDDNRLARLKQDTDSSTLVFQNASGNDILKLDGARDVFMDNIKAPTGNIYSLSIDDTGKIVTNPSISPANYLPLAGGTMVGDIEMSDGYQIIQEAGGGYVLGNSLIHYLAISDDGLDFGSNLGTFKGAQYQQDYSANYTDRSLVDKGFLSAYLELSGGTMTGALDMGGNYITVNELKNATGILDLFMGADKLRLDYSAIAAGVGTYVQTFRQKAGTIAHLDDIPEIVYAFAASDEITDLSAGASDVVYTDYMASPITVNSVMISVNEAPTGDDIIVDIHQNGSSIFTTEISIDATENTSLTAATPYVLDGTISYVQGDKIEVYIDQVGSTIAGAGLKIKLIQ